MALDIIKITENVEFSIEKAKVNLPHNYSVMNALQSAWLVIKALKNKKGQYLTDICTEESVNRALFSMCIQGLNPLKEQCYFIPHGSHLDLMRSYLGSMAVAKRVDDKIWDIKAYPIFEGVDFCYEIVDGQQRILPYRQTLADTQKKIVGVYALALGHDRKPFQTEIMNFGDVLRSWRMSKLRDLFLSNGKLNPESTHARFPERMARRTVISRLCKHIIDTSDDELLLKAAIESEEEINVSEAMQHATKQITLDFDDDVIDITSHNKTEGAPPSSEIGGTGAPPSALKEVNVDFKPDPGEEKHEEIKPEEKSVEMAGNEDRLKIWELEKKKGNTTKEKTLGRISEFAGRPITGIGQLTKSEAQQYIEVLEKQPSENNSLPIPDWL